MNMGNFRIYQDNYADFTVVSNRFIDEFMEDANDAQLKIYLYLMRMLGADQATGISDIADRFNYTEKDVMRALRFWEKKGILQLDYDSSKTLTGVHMLPLCSDDDADRTAGRGAATAKRDTAAAGPTPAQLTVVPPQLTAVNPVINYEKPQFSKDDMARFKSSQIFFIAEQYLQKTLTPADINTLLFISGTLHFSDDLTDYLLQYCIEHGKTGHRYIETVAVDWAQSAITTPEQAKAYVAKYDAPKRKAGSQRDNKFNQFTQNTYDYDALEKALISN